MVSRPDPTDKEWMAALAAGHRADRDPMDLRLFHERRAWLRARLVAPGDQLDVTAGGWSGLAGERRRSPEKSIFLADPGPDDVGHLVSALKGSAFPSTGRLRAHREEGGRVACSSAQEVVPWLRRIAAGVEASHPSATVAVDWVEHEQRVVASAAEEGAGFDLRHSRRLRVEIAQGARPRTVGEAVVGPAASLEETSSWLVGELCRRHAERAGPRTMQAGLRPVVFAAGVGGIWVHELIGHALEADVVQQGLSWLGRTSESEVGSREIVVVDDPRRSRAAWRMDDEGTPTRAIGLFQDRRVVATLRDRRAASRDHRPSTGHGRRASYRDPVLPRMGCTFLGAGYADPSEVIAEVVDGVYVRRMEAASTDIRTGRAMFRVTDADRISEGRLDAPLLPFMLVFEDGPSAISSVERVASDLTFDTCIGSCIRGGQPLAMTVGAPTFRVGSARVVSWETLS